jgi:hypothetical protein
MVAVPDRTNTQQDMDAKIVLLYWSLHHKHGHQDILYSLQGYKYLLHHTYAQLDKVRTSIYPVDQNLDSTYPQDKIYK